MGQRKQINHELNILREIFFRVGLDYLNGGSEFVKQDDWYMKHTWTEKERDDFIDWLAEYIKKNRLVRSRHHHEASKWVANFGWKTEYPSTVVPLEKLENESNA